MGSCRAAQLASVSCLMDISAITQTVLGWIFKLLHLRQEVRVLCHHAYLRPSAGCYFVNVTNLSLSRHVQITHVWFKCEPEVHVLNPERPLPRLLRPEESWETWIEADKLPHSMGDQVYTMARVRLSNGRIFKSKLNEDVPSAGFVPGS